MANPRRGQISAEMLIVLGLSLALLIPVAAVVFSKISSSGESVSLSQADYAAESLSGSINSVSYLGSGASQVVDLRFPEGSRKISANGHELVFSLSLQSGETEIVKNTNAVILLSEPIETPNPGLYRMLVKSEGQVEGQPAVSLSLYGQ